MSATSNIMQTLRRLADTAHDQTYTNPGNPDYATAFNIAVHAFSAAEQQYNLAVEQAKR